MSVFPGFVTKKSLAAWALAFNLMTPFTHPSYCLSEKFRTA